MKKSLKIQQLDKRLSKLKNMGIYSRPKVGWIRMLRKALGMTDKQLAQRLHVNRSRVVRIEKDELNDALTLKTLQAVARALECDLVYALVPRKTLSETLQARAELIASQRLKYVTHSMALEDQRVSEDMLDIQRNTLVDELLAGNLKYLWNDD